VAIPKMSLTEIGGWFTPPKNPPQVAENKWRPARLKINIAAAGDSGAIENITPTLVFNTLKAQQGIDVTAALSSCRIKSIFSYSVPGVADSGGQVYPSTKIRVYSPEEDSSQGVLIAQREDSGTLDSVARIGYTFPRYLSGRVLNGDATAFFAQIENYHTARGYVYLDIMWTANPN